MVKVSICLKTIFIDLCVFLGLVNNILDLDIRIADNGVLTDRVTPTGRIIYYVNRTLTNPENLKDNTFWGPIDALIGSGFSFVVEWLPVNIIDFMGYVVRINGGTNLEFSVRLTDPTEATDAVMKVLVLRIPGSSTPVRIRLTPNDIPDTNELWQYGLSANRSHVSFWFNCSQSSVVADRSVQQAAFFILDNSTLEIGNPNGIYPFYVSLYCYICQTLNHCVTYLHIISVHLFNTVGICNVYEFRHNSFAVSRCE